MGHMKPGDVPPETRENAVLAFLLDHGFAMPPAVIYRGMKATENIHFSKRTVENILKRMHERGYVMRCDKDALNEGRIKPLPEDAEDRRTYYYVTDAGTRRLAEADLRRSYGVDLPALADTGDLIGLLHAIAEEDDGLTVADLANAVGWSTGAAEDMLEQFEDASLIDIYRSDTGPQFVLREAARRYLRNDESY